MQSACITLPTRLAVFRSVAFHGFNGNGPSLHALPVKELLDRYAACEVRCSPLAMTGRQPALEAIMDCGAYSISVGVLGEDFGVLTARGNGSGPGWRYLISPFSSVSFLPSRERTEGLNDEEIFAFIKYFFKNLKTVVPNSPRFPSFKDILSNAEKYQLIFEIMDDSSASIHVRSGTDAFRYSVSPTIERHSLNARIRYIEDQILEIGNIEGLLAFLVANLKLERISLYEAEERDGRYFPDRKLDHRKDGTSPNSLWNGRVATEGFITDPRRKPMHDLLTGKDNLLVVPAETMAKELHKGQGSIILLASRNSVTRVLLLESPTTTTLEELAENGLASVIRYSAEKLFRLEKEERAKKKAQQEAEMTRISSERLTELMKGILHDDKTFAAGLRGLTLLIARLDDPDKRREIIARLERSVGDKVEYLTYLLGESGLFDPNNPKLMSRNAKIRIGDIMEKVLEEARGLLNDALIKKDITIKVEDTNEDITIFIDQDHLKSIIDNLLVNAISYGHTPGQGVDLITVRCRLVDQEVVRSEYKFESGGPIEIKRKTRERYLYIGVRDNGALPDIVGDTKDSRITQGNPLKISGEFILEENHTLRSATPSNISSSTGNGLRDVILRTSLLGGDRSVVGVKPLAESGKEFFVKLYLDDQQFN